MSISTYNTFSESGLTTLAEHIKATRAKALSNEGAITGLGEDLAGLSEEVVIALAGKADSSDLDEFTAHISDTNNPHSLTAEQLGLDGAVVYSEIEGGTAQMPSSKSWSSVTYGNGRFVAVANESTAAAYSDDGINWTGTSLPISAYWGSVTYGNSRFVAVASSSTTAAYSTDGINWTEATLPSSVSWYSVTYGNGRFVAVARGSTTAAYSDDGITWTTATLPGKAYWDSVTYGNGRFVAVAKNSTNAAYSTDGINWTDKGVETILTDSTGTDITESVKALMAPDLTGIATETYVNEAVASHEHLFDRGVTTSGTGAAYTATVDGIDALEAGLSFIMIPHTASTSKTATLNVNGLGAKTLRRPLSANNVSTVAASADNWITASKPIRVMYNGTYWLVMDMARPNAPDIYGTVDIENGGTGASTASAALTALGAQAKITGTAGQFVVIGDDGNPTTMSLTNVAEVGA